MRRLGRSGKAITVSTVDAAQGQEADLVIISLVKANSSGKVGFTDDARRLNVAAVTRAKAGVVMIGHLATSLAASSPGFRTLLHDLKMQGGIFEYRALGARERMRHISNVDYVRQDTGGHPDHSPRAKTTPGHQQYVGSGSLGNLDSKRTRK